MTGSALTTHAAFAQQGACFRARFHSQAFEPGPGERQHIGGSVAALDVPAVTDGAVARAVRIERSSP